jgi:putative DNA primase/helicase
MVQLVPMIRESIAVFRRAAADRFDSQRQGDQYGTLLAGAWALQSSVAATLDNAYTMIDKNNWEPYREASEIPDEQRCLQLILQHQIRVEGDRGIGYHRTIGELVDLASSGFTAPTSEISTAAAEAHLGRIGIKVEAGNLLVSNTATGIAKILADTPWAHSWSTVLTRLPGAAKAGVTRFRGLGDVSRAVSIPIADL